MQCNATDPFPGFSMNPHTRWLAAMDATNMVGGNLAEVNCPTLALPAWTRCYLCNQPLDPKDAHDVVWSEHRWCAEEQARIDRELEAAYDAKLDRGLREHYAMLDAIDEERNADWTAVAS